jgi:hypothetical protein
VINVRKILTIIGTLLTVTIVLSGSVVATWVYAQNAWGTDCTNELNARFAPDGNHATAGKNNPPTLGTLYLDLGSTNKMPPDTEFTVFAGSAVMENYSVEVMTDDLTLNTTVGYGWDTENLTFNTPSDQGHLWQYIIIHGVTGLTRWPDDQIYGPEIDAGGWNKP